MFKGFVIAAALAASTSVFAAPTQMSDSQYIAVARCDGLADSKALAGGDAASMDAVVKAEGHNRSPDVTDRADEARSDALREANHAGPQGKAGLVAERDGACQAWAHSASDMASASHSTNAN